MLETLQRVFSTDFMSHNDNAFLDLTIDKSLEINDDIGIEPNVYYFSYAGNQTCRTRSPATTSRRQRCGRCSIPVPANMGKYYDKYTAGGFTSTRAGVRTTAWSTPCPPSTPSTATAPA